MTLHRQDWLLFVTTSTVLSICWFLLGTFYSGVGGPSHCAPLSFGEYTGSQYVKGNQTVKVRTLAETPFARFQVHSVRIGPHKVVHDWLWLDERDHVVILVQLGAKVKLPPSLSAFTKQGPSFLVFEQTKYAFEGLALAPIGGYIEDGESATQAATREILEETGLVPQKLVSLGRYRTAANRGGGYCNSFLALNCFVSPTSKASDDLEAQHMRVLSRDELVNALMAARFQEGKWTATIALALLSGQI
eukprot:gb/GEZN01015478.1/.p1 GENE.gb/GEZN01015478.1/~~gb/GEZN01015478.1/.p1  ORF type:complete len:247 (+),score=27.01 gb/GEZN01015478.1/:103-843(+)